MKRGKDDEKMMGPMFPRLHVNDTEKGGPRAPPRNKMALYEQLSTPSNRFNHGGYPPNSTASNNLVPAASTSQGSGTGQKSVFSHHVLSSSTTSSHVDEKRRTRQPDDRNSNASSRHLEQRSKVADEDDFMVPVFVHSSLGKTQNGNDGERPTNFVSNHLACSSQIQNTGGNDENNTTEGAILRQDEKNQNGEHLEVCVLSRDHSVRSSVSASTRYNVAIYGNASLSRQNDQPDANFCRLSKDNVSLQQESTVSAQENDNRRGVSVSELAREIEKRNNPGPLAVSDSYSGDNINCQGEAETDSKFQGDRTCRSQQFVNGDKSDISETSVLDSVTEVTVTPDDVVGLIGQKRFWKARRAIVNQQRVFALQVFELHKLIKVQQLIAASPHLLLENGAFLAKSSPKVSSAKKLPSEYILVPPVHVAKPKNNSTIQTNQKEHSAENGPGKTSHSSVVNTNQPSNYDPYTNPTPNPLPTENKTSPWGFHLNQWLVPVMSPSEGLVYKPYTLPGVMDRSHPFGAVPFNGNFFNPCYGVPPSHHPHGNGVMPGFPPVGHGYFPPYGMPFVDPHVSGSQVQSSGGLSGVGANFNLHNQSSCNVQTKKRGPDSQVTKPQASRERLIPVSSASSPRKKEQAVRSVQAVEGEDTIARFSVAPEEVAQPLETGQAARVIKVVPHNRRSATASAARIFQSIQEERKRHDSD